MHRVVAAALAVVAAVACSGPQLKQHVADLSKSLPATLETERPKEGDARTVDVRVYADAGVRALPRWKDEITDQIDYASQLLTPLVGVKLAVKEIKDWDRTGDPHEALKQLKALDKGEGVVWVLGYIAANDTSTTVMSELGDAEPLGRHAIVRAWAEKPETDALASSLPDLKEAERNEVLNAHERHKQTVVLLHAIATTLGAIAETDPQWIQHVSYSSKQLGFSDRNRELLQLAIDERITDGADVAIAKKLLEAIEKSEWGGWVGAEKELVVNRLRNVIDATKAGKTATDIPPAAYDQVTRIKVLAQQGKTDDALAELDNVIAAYPGNAALTQLKCELLIAPKPQAPPKQGEKPKAPLPPDAKAVAACKRVIELAPADPGPYLALAEAFLRANDRPGARAQLVEAEAKLVALGAGNEAAWKKIVGMYYPGMGSLTWAEDAIAKAKLDKDPIAVSIAQVRNRYGVPRGGELVPPEQEGELVASFKAAQSLVYAKKYGEAEKALAAAEKRWPGAPGLAAERCELHFYQGQKDAAKAACARSLAAFPDESWALYMSAILAFQDASGTKPGIEHLKKAIAVDPELGQAWRTLAKAYARAKDTAARDQLAKDYQAKFGSPLPP